MRVGANAEHPARELLLYLRTLAGTRGRGRFFDVRWALPHGGMRRAFIPANRVHEAAWRITRLACRADVYVGVALRDRRHGGKSAISGGHLVYIECDDPDAGERLSGFPFPPSIVVASGSPGHLHIYWRLAERAENAQVESANRRLALALRGDPACVDIARVLRPPASMNHKHKPSAPVLLVAEDPRVRYTLAELTGDLPEDPAPADARGVPSAPRRAGRTALDRELFAIPPAEYVRVLAGREPNRAGKVLCPFHPDTDPSLQLYPDGGFYCFGSACRRGGTIFDFAAAKWGMGTRNEDFLELRRRLASKFGLTPTSNGGSAPRKPRKREPRDQT
jgi:RepB DNA-primase from phage plasmid/CHC2 zinc finger